jgi:hypothetical protein
MAGATTVMESYSVDALMTLGNHIFSKLTSTIIKISQLTLILKKTSAQSYLNLVSFSKTSQLSLILKK